VREKGAFVGGGGVVGLCFDSGENKTNVYDFVALYGELGLFKQYIPSKYHDQNTSMTAFLFQRPSFLVLRTVGIRLSSMRPVTPGTPCNALLNREERKYVRRRRRKGKRGDRKTLKKHFGLLG